MCDKSDVYGGEVAQVDPVSELVGRFDGIIDGLCSLFDVAGGSVGGVRSNGFKRMSQALAYSTSLMSSCAHLQPSM